MAFQDVRSKHGSKLLFRYDPECNTVEIIANGAIELVDLSDFEAVRNRRARLIKEKLTEALKLVEIELG